MLETGASGGWRESSSYLAVAPGLTVRSFADLKGRTVAVLKGTACQRPFDALLADAGLTEKDVDATFGGADLHLLKDQGVTLPISTKGRGPAYNIHAAVLATDGFIRRYPIHTPRLVNQVVRAARWGGSGCSRCSGRRSHQAGHSFLSKPPRNRGDSATACTLA